MPNMQKQTSRSDTQAPEFERFMDELRAILIDGIKYGFFDCAISVQVSRANRREVLISVGKSYKYTIIADDLPR